MNILKSFALVASFLLCSFVSVAAQAPQNFSGDWLLASQTGASNPAPPGSDRRTVVQTASELTITRMVGESEARTVYRLDGSESRNTVPRGRSGTVERVSMATWEGQTLVVATLGDAGAVTNTSNWSIDIQGRLVIESRNSGAESTITSFYERASNAH